MSKKVYLDNDGHAVGKGTVEAAWVFTEGDIRIEKFRNAVAGRKAVAAGRPIPGSTAALVAELEETTVERVSRR